MEALEAPVKKRKTDATETSDIQPTRTLKGPDDFRDKKILAPMVRAGTLPLRLLSLKYGADIVFAEELIDKSILKTERVENKALGLVEYIRGKQSIFVTCPNDSPTVFQMGSCDATLALEAAMKVYQDVAGFDLNMGCPKKFSVSGGMGAALLSKPELVFDILTTLTRNVDKPITAKIRLVAAKDVVKSTIELMRVIQSCNVAAITVHARTIDERPKDPAQWDALRDVISGHPWEVPIIINGDIFKYEDIALSKARTGASSVMIARGALRSPAVFQPTPVKLWDAQAEYLKLCVKVDNHPSNTKYTLLRMLSENHICGGDLGKKVSATKGLRNFCTIWGMEGYYDSLHGKSES